MLWTFGIAGSFVVSELGVTRSFNAGLAFSSESPSMAVAIESKTAETFAGSRVVPASNALTASLRFARRGYIFPETETPAAAGLSDVSIVLRCDVFV
jgi:hypothetical protein